MTVVNSEPVANSRRSIAIVALLIACTFAVRVWRADQPIVENYVGRQVPTAMVAHNLERDGRFWMPRLHTGPFPNYFVVEPPLQAALAVLIRKISGIGLDASGRVVAALGMTLAVWGLVGLVQRQYHLTTALMAGLCLTLMPITMRYGRAFQGDSLMLGALLASLRLIDQKSKSGWAVGALALGLKVSAGLVWLPLAWRLGQQSRKVKALAVGLALIPVLVWYVYAVGLVRGSSETGSRAAQENFGIWSRVLLSQAWLHLDFWKISLRYLGWTCFTPLGWVLTLVGWRSGKLKEFWKTWFILAILTLLILAGKAHHEYYWLLVAPPMAVGMTLGWLALVRRSKWIAVIVGLAFLACSIRQSAPTWTLPAEWSAIRLASVKVVEQVPEGAWLVAPEALLQQADRIGCRLEWNSESVARAADEWGVKLNSPRAENLIEVYRSQGAAYFADLIFPDMPQNRVDDSLRSALHDWIRRHHDVLVDEPGVVLIARLRPSTRVIH